MMGKVIDITDRLPKQEIRKPQEWDVNEYFRQINKRYEKQIDKVKAERKLQNLITLRPYRIKN